MVFAQRRQHESLDEYYDRLRERSGREDLVMFINSCFAATRQSDYYTSQSQQSVSIDFLHDYVLANYRRLYARALAVGINDFSRALIVTNLLKSGAPNGAQQRAEEGRLIKATLRRLPANRVYALFKRLQKLRVNNRRTRAVVKAYLQFRNDTTFDAIKYRGKLTAIAAHVHLKLPGEVGTFLFSLKQQRRFQTELFDRYRQAHYSASAIYDLPFTVAESLAVKHKVPRDVFLKRIQHKMTAAEKLRYQSSASKKGASIDFDFARAPITKLALYALSLSSDERQARAEELNLAFKESARRTCTRSMLKLGRVAAVLDKSRSSVGSSERRNRPLAVAIAASYVLRQAATEFQAFWAPQTTCMEEGFEFQRRANGQTNLASSVLDALAWNPDLLVIVSDGYENDPPLAVNQIVQIFRSRIGKADTPEIVHANPVFDSNHFAPRPLGNAIATVGLRDAEELATMLGFARFASGSATLLELEDYLLHQTQRVLGDNDE